MPRKPQFEGLQSQWVEPWGLLGLEGVFHACLWGHTPRLISTIAALMIAGLIPGWLFLRVLRIQIDSWLERSVLAIGTGFCVMVLVMLGISYLPGGATQGITLLGFDAVTLGLWIWCYAQGQEGLSRPVSPVGQAKSLDFQQIHWIWIVLLMGITGFYRFANLDYSNFQGDEARAILRGVEVIQGHEEVFFLHKKGPVEILLPTVIYSLTGQLNELTARLPFALANWTGILGLFFVGQRWFGSIAGYSAALLLAINGYFIGFGRIVQYQSIVFLMTVLAVWAMTAFTEQPKISPNPSRDHLLNLTALFGSTAFLCHYGAITIALPVGYLGGCYWRDRTPRKTLSSQKWRVPLLILLSPLIYFYLPFFLHPNFVETFSYVGQRIGGQLPYNHLVDFFAHATLYNSTYYMVGFITVTIAQFWASNGYGWDWRLAGLSTTLLVVGLLRPDGFTLAGMDWTVIVFLVPIVGLWLAPRLPRLERLVWIWFGSLFLLACFAVAKPNTHVYLFFIPWSLLVGLGLQNGWGYLSLRFPYRWLKASLFCLSTTLFLIFSHYSYWYFVDYRTEILRDWHYERLPGYWTVYSEPSLKKLFGFPQKSGWNVIPLLYEDGILNGRYTTNDRIWVAQWYIPNLPICFGKCDYFFFVDNLEERERYQQELKDLQKDYSLFATITVNEQPRLWIYQLGKSSTPPQVFRVEDYQSRIDRNRVKRDLLLTGAMDSP